MSKDDAPRLLVGTRKGLFTLKRKRKRWKVTRVDHEAASVDIVMKDPRDGAIYAALDHGHFGVKLHRRAAGKDAEWEEITAPVYPDKPDGFQDLDANGRDVPWNLVKVWSLVPGHAHQPGRLWCGTLPGGLFKSDDGGGSWQLVESLWDRPERKEWFGGGYDWPGIHSILLHPERHERVVAGVSCGGVWVSEDDGASWTVQADGMRAEYMPPERAGDPLIQDPHCVVQCPTEPDRLWAQHHNGIFRSDDGSRSWVEIETAEPSAFGFPVAVHPKDPDTAWFLPAVKDEHRVPVDGKVVVSRTRDAGRTFEVLRDGLPQEHAYDLVWRHALDVDATGERLAFGSTTGSLFVSEDGGDRWEAVSHHLPPIACVRFAP